MACGSCHDLKSEGDVVGIENTIFSRLEISLHNEAGRCRRVVAEKANFFMNSRNGVHNPVCRRNQYL